MASWFFMLITFCTGAFAGYQMRQENNNILEEENRQLRGENYELKKLVEKDG